MRGSTLGVLLSAAAVSCAAEELPARSLDAVLGIPDDLLLYEQVPTPPGGLEKPDPNVEVARIEAELKRAKKGSTNGERLFKDGDIAKIDAERRALKVVRLTRELERARAEAQDQGAQDLRDGTAEQRFSPDSLRELEVALCECRKRAEEAAKACHEAELAGAELNLARQRKLLSAGIGRRYLVERAEAQVEALKKVTGSAPRG